MGLEQKKPAALCVMSGHAGAWDVIEDGFDKPLASFVVAQDAFDYAHDLAREKAGTTVKIFDSYGTRLSLEGSVGLPR